MAMERHGAVVGVQNVHLSVAEVVAFKASGETMAAPFAAAPVPSAAATPARLPWRLARRARNSA